MKKGIVAVLLACTMVMSLVGCGGSDTAPAAATEEKAEEVEEEADEIVASDSDDEVTDDVWSSMQDAYVNVVELYNAVVDYYTENDDIPKDEDVESVLADAKEAIEMVGEIDRSEVTLEDCLSLADSMDSLVDTLSTIADALDIMAEGGAAAGEMCSDETFGELQEIYAQLTEIYDTVATYYTENDAIAQSDEIEQLLQQAYEAIDYMGEVQQSEITEADAEELATSMGDMAEALDLLVDAM